MKTLAQAASCLDDYDPNALSVEGAGRIIAECIAPVSEHETLPVRAALGRILATDIISTLDVPAHDNSAMDGYAVRHADLNASGPTIMREIGSSFAGHAFAGPVGKGECVRIMTGAVMPADTDTVENAIGTPPPAATPSLALSACGPSDIEHGVFSPAVLTMPTNDFCIASSSSPVARKKARCGARDTPSVTILERCLCRDIFELPLRPFFRRCFSVFLSARRGVDRFR